MLTQEDLMAIATLMDKKLEPIKEQLKELEPIKERLDGVDKRLDGMDKRLDGMDKRLYGMEDRLDGMDEQLKVLDKKNTDTRSVIEPKSSTPSACWQKDTPRSSSTWSNRRSWRGSTPGLTLWRTSSRCTPNRSGSYSKRLDESIVKVPCPIGRRTFLQSELLF